MTMLPASTTLAGRLPANSVWARAITNMAIQHRPITHRDIVSRWVELPPYRYTHPHKIKVAKIALLMAKTERNCLEMSHSIGASLGHEKGSCEKPLRKRSITILENCITGERCGSAAAPQLPAIVVAQVRRRIFSRGDRGNMSSLRAGRKLYNPMVIVSV
jgi:hypothetical protein